MAINARINANSSLGQKTGEDSPPPSSARRFSAPAIRIGPPSSYGEEMVDASKMREVIMELQGLGKGDRVLCGVCVQAVTGEAGGRGEDRCI